MNRRNFISLTTLTAATISVPFFNCSNTNSALDKTLGLPQTLSQILDKKTLAVIGAAYGAARPNEYTASKLEQQLANGSKAKIISSAPVKDIYSILNKSIEDDFETGNTIILNGWVIALTEARQCALFSIIQKHN
jgi:hypothetical protein